MSTKRTNERDSKTSRRGRPRRAPDEVRSRRVVTFVAEWELEGLEQIALEEERSLSTVVHRIIAQHLKNKK